MRDLPLLSLPARPPVLLLGTSHMIGEIVMTAEAGAAAVCLSARLRGHHLSAVGAVEDVVGVRCVCRYGCSDGRGKYSWFKILVI